MSMDQTVRQVDRLVSGMPTNDGAGVRLTRIIGQPGLSELDPFLLLDEFRSDVAGDYIAGFPDHPHRGFETVTYMLAGRMRHGDNQGNTGL
ncbi:MAG: pirin family protein, partial [Proteobacteria bacterium]|nr:pirin family protein [Pseudomonadota bacterium]